MDPIEDVLIRHTERLMALPGVFGVAIGQGEGGPCIEVQTSRITEELRRQVPEKLDGVSVRIRELGRPELF